MEPEPHEVEWRPVVGYEGLYEVSEHGDVRRLGGTPKCWKTRVLTPYIHEASSWPRVSLARDGTHKDFRIHALVAQAFLGVVPVGHESGESIQVDHIDGNKWNNDYRNLEYVTLKENHARARALGLSPRGERCGSAKLTAAVVREIRAMPAAQHIVAAVYGVSQMTVSLIKRKLIWKHIE